MINTDNHILQIMVPDLPTSDNEVDDIKWMYYDQDKEESND